MNNYNDTGEIKTRIQRILTTFINEYPQIRSAYLFGSAAQGKAETASDIDIAIRLSPEQPPESCFHLRLELMGAVGDALGRKTDIVILNTASLYMIHQVLRHGILLHAKSMEDEADYADVKQKEYFDFKYYVDRDRKALKSFYGVP
jgi:predicted nucleotidyltransferase